MTIAETADERRRVNIGGRHLAMREAGAGVPAVVLEAGGGCTSAEWDAILAAVARFTRVLSYDRAGLGASDPAPTPRTFGDMVADRRALLANAAVPPPYVLVGHSMGGLLALLHAHQHPDEVAGLVLVDSPHPEQNRRAAALLPPPSPDDSPRFQNMRYLLTGGYEQDPRWNPEGLHVAASDIQVEALGPLGDCPMVVLTASRHEQPPDLPTDYLAAYDRMARALMPNLVQRSSAGRHVIAEQSGHFIHLDEPDLVIDAIWQVVATVCGQS